MKRSTYRGQVIDIDMLRMANQGAIAVGNANYNARGDLIGRGGTVLKTREELETEHIRNKTKDDSTAVVSDAGQREAVDPMDQPDDVVTKPQTIRKRKTPTDSTTGDE